MVSSESSAVIDVHVTAGKVEAAGRAWPLRQVSSVEVREGTDFTVSFIEIVAAAFLFTAAIAIALVGESVTWALLMSVPGVALVAMAVQRGVWGVPLYAVVLHRGEQEDVVYYSSDRRLVAEVAERVRSACV